MRTTVNPERLDDLKKELQDIRRASLLASRRGDYLKVAKLTHKAADLNKAIVEAEGLVLV